MLVYSRYVHRILLLCVTDRLCDSKLYFMVFYGNYYKSFWGTDTHAKKQCFQNIYNLILNKNKYLRLKNVHTF